MLLTFAEVEFLVALADDEPAVDVAMLLDEPTRDRHDMVSAGLASLMARELLVEHLDESGTAGFVLDPQVVALHTAMHSATTSVKITTVTPERTTYWLLLVGAHRSALTPVAAGVYAADVMPMSGYVREQGVSLRFYPGNVGHPAARLEPPPGRGGEPAAQRRNYAYRLNSDNIIALFRFIKVTTEIDSSLLSVCLFPFCSKKVSITSIESIEFITYKFVGFGCRLGTEYGTVFNVKGNQGFQILTKNGDRFLVGTQRPSEILTICTKLGVNVINSDRNIKM